MTNLQATYNLCNAILNTFYPDKGAIEVTLANYGIEAEADYVAKSADVFRATKSLCMGYIEGSRSENGVSISVQSEDSIKRALRHWCKEFGLDEEEELGDMLEIISDATHRW